MPWGGQTTDNSPKIDETARACPCVNDESIALTAVRKSRLELGPMRTFAACLVFEGSAKISGKPTRAASQILKLQARLRAAHFSPGTKAEVATFIVGHATGVEI